MAPVQAESWRLLVSSAPEDGQQSDAKVYCVTKRIAVRIVADSQDNVINTIAAANVECLKNPQGKWWVIGNRKHIRTEALANSKVDLTDKSILGGLLVCLCHSMPLNRIIVTPPPGLHDSAMWAVKMHALGFRKLTSTELAEAPSALSARGHVELTDECAVYCVDEDKRAGLIVGSESLLRHLVVQEPQRDPAPESKSAKAAARVRKLLRAYQKKKTVEFEIVSIDETWPLGELGAFLLDRTGEIDGICARMICSVEGEKLPTGRGRAYHVRGSGNNVDWWVLGDPIVIHLARKNGLH